MKRLFSGTGIVAVLVQVGLGSILLTEGLLVLDTLLLEPRLASLAALAAALATQ